MRRPIVIALALVSIALLGATAVFYSKYRTSMAEYAQATAAGDSMRVHYERAVNEIVMIQDSLSTIVMGEEAASRLASRQEVELQPPGTLHDQVLERIATLKNAIERTKDRIEDLDKRLKKSGVQVAGLERMVSGLKKNLSEREERIATLNTQVGELETRVAGLSTEVTEQQEEIIRNEEEIARKRQEIATIYYAVGTKKELRLQGLVVEEGGVLGFGKTVKPSGYYAESAFAPLDTDQENVIRIPADKAEVLSAQPSSSYELRPVGKEMVELRILDPTAFRKVKHVVIMMS